MSLITPLPMKVYFLLEVNGEVYACGLHVIFWLGGVKKRKEEHSDYFETSYFQMDQFLSNPCIKVKHIS